MSEEAARLESARARLVSYRNKRFELVTETRLPPDAPRPSGVLWRLGRALWKRLGLNRSIAQGVVDYSERRFALDYGSYALLSVDGREWDGPPGGGLRDSYPTEGPTPLWLLDLLLGARQVSAGSLSDPESGDPHEFANGGTQHFVVVVDMALAARRIDGLALPRMKLTNGALELRADAWLEGDALHSVRAAYENQTLTITFRSVEGTDGDYDWSRLPRLKAAE